jgi:malic enzyme
VLDQSSTLITAMKIVVCGAGSAGLGVVSWLAKAMVTHGL